ncbi:uncharacterized protein METZ01_LOCUS310524, partial [marine metagenome]
TKKERNINIIVFLSGKEYIIELY